MAKKEAPVETKQPKTVEVKLLVPYAIIIVMLISLAGIITGWQARGMQESEIKTQAAHMVQLSKAEQ